TGTALAMEPSATSTLAAATAHGAGPGLTVFDLDWRPELWPDRETYAARCAAILPHADLVLGGDAEIDAASGGRGAAALRAAGVPVVVAKHGPDGCTLHAAGAATHVRGLPVPVVNGLGAGDAFAAAFGASLLDAPGELERAAQRANAAGAI